MLAPDQKPTMRSFLDATQNFASGKETPRAFLERSLATARLLGAAHRRLRLHQPAGGARSGGEVHRTLARRQAAVADRRHAGRHQGHLRDRRHADRDGLAALRRLAVQQGLRERAGAARRRRGHRRQDGDDGVCGIRAARHAQSVERRAHAGRIVERLGGFRRGRHRQRGARHAGDRLDAAAGELLRLRRFQDQRQRAQPPGQSRLPEPELHRHPRRDARRHLAGRLRNRRARRRRRRNARPARSRQGAGGKEAEEPRGARNRRLGYGVRGRQEAPGRIGREAEIGRHRHSHPPQRQEGRRARSRAGQSHRAVAPLQRLGSALVSPHHEGQGRRAS